MSNDRNFDEVFEKFQLRIKNSDKGRLRGILIREDLAGCVPGLDSESLQILDSGCGLGDMSLWLAQKGHQVDATDISAKMVAYAQQQAAEHGLLERMRVEQRSLQASLQSGKSYDLICLHAVMEWLAEPYEMLKLLKPSLKPGGMVSLTVYNLHRSIFNSLVKGSFQSILRGDFSGRSNPLTPPHPIQPERLVSELQELGFAIQVHAGLRCFYDYLPHKKMEPHDFEDILLLERRYRNQPPYRDIARYVHVLAKWA